MKKNKKYVFTKSDAEVEEFMYNSAETVHKVCRHFDLDENDESLLAQNLLVKYAEGKIEYDPTKGATESTYIYGIAKNLALDLLRQRQSEVKHFGGSRDNDTDAGDCDEDAA